MKSLLRKMLCITAAVILSGSALLPYTKEVSAAWEKSGSSWVYTEGGSRLIGWQKINGVWYFFNVNGVMQTGWQKISGSWYYFNAGGAMKTGWVKLDGNWYFFNGGGVMKTGWVYTGGNWYFFNGGGVMKTGWVYTGGKWYYMNSDGQMQTGWQIIKDKRYYFDSDGVMQTGTVYIGTDIYVFASSGELETTEVKDDSSSSSPSGSETSSSDSIAEEVLEQVNYARKNEGLSSLILSDKLSEAALARAKEQAEMGTISHQRPDGTEWYTLLVEYGISASGSGENLAVNYSTASAVVKAWLESPAHKANIVNTQYKSMGLSRYESDGNIYWVQLFSVNTP